MAIANIVVNDGKATPLAHTFIPVQDGAKARYVNDAGALTLKGQETLALDITRTTSSNQASTAKLSLWDPVEVTDVTGVTTVDHGSSAEARLNFAPNSTEAERTDVIMLLVNALTAKKSDIAKLLPQL